MNILVVTAWAYNPHELWPILTAIRKEHGTFTVLAEKPIIEEEYGKWRGKRNLPRYSVTTINDFKNDIESYDGLVITSGQRTATEKLHYDKKLLEIVKAFDDQKKPIAAICVSVPVLRFIMKGRRCTCFPSYADLLKENGAIYEDRTCVVDKNVITVPAEIWVTVMMDKFLEGVKVRAV